MLKNTNITGAISEAMVAGYLMSQGYEVFPANHAASRADLLYIKDGVSFKVQVKTANWTAGTNKNEHRYEHCVLKRTQSAAYTAEEVDEFWVVGTHLWCFPYASLPSVTNIALGTTNPEPRKTARSYDPNKFIVVHGNLEFPYRERLFRDSTSPFLSPTNNEYQPDSLRSLQYKDREPRWIS